MAIRTEVAMAHQICVPRDDQRDVRLVGLEGNGDDVAHQAAVITSLLASTAGIHQQIYGSVQECINWPVACMHHMQRTIQSRNPNYLLAFESVHGRRPP
jgi:hypothetical protein